MTASELLNLVTQSDQTIVQLLIVVVRRRWRGIAWGLLTLAALAFCLVSLGGLLNIPMLPGHFWLRLAWVTELTSHFRVQYLAALSVLSLLFFIGHHFRRSLIIAGFALMNLVLIIPLYVAPAPQPSVGPAYRILMLNVGAQNKSDTSLNDLIQSAEPDIIVLLEAREDTSAGVGSIRDKYPYAAYRAGRDSFDGYLLLSKFPFTDEGTQLEPGKGQSSLVSRFMLAEQVLTLVSAQTPAPIRPGRTESRHRHLNNLAQFAAQQSGPVLVLGDFNTTPWSPIYRDFLSQSGLRSGRNGFGVQASWPTFMPLLAIPIDHVLVSTNIVVRDFSLGPDVGSDHFPVLVDISLS